MNRKEVFEKLMEILTGDDFVVLSESLKNINEDSSLINDLALDSLQVLNLVVLIEKKFGFSCDEEELNLDLFDRVSELIDFIQSKQKKVC